MFYEKSLAGCNSNGIGTSNALLRNAGRGPIWRFGIKVALDSRVMMARWPFLRRFCPLILLAVLACAHLRAATYNALSPNRTDVANAVASAVDGDTVVMPAGTATWSQGLSTFKAISIKGGGVGVTVIVAGYTNQYGGGIIAYTPGSAQAAKVFELS